jgi:hypothetical protein
MNRVFFQPSSQYVNKSFSANENTPIDALKKLSVERMITSPDSIQDGLIIIQDQMARPIRLIPAAQAPKLKVKDYGKFATYDFTNCQTITALDEISKLLGR